MSGDWADERAREWLDHNYRGRGWDKDDAHNLAALLHDVAAQAEQNELEALAQQKVEVCRVVEEVTLAYTHEETDMALGEILRRLEAL